MDADDMRDPAPVEARLTEVLGRLREEHIGLVQQLHQFDQELQAAEGALDGQIEEWQRRLQALGAQAGAFAQRLRCHVQDEDEQLLPVLQACLGEEDAAPSVRFSSLLMEQYCWSGLEYLNLFVEQCGQPPVLRSGRDAKRVLYHLREALILLSACFKVERAYMLRPAERALEE